MVVGNSESFAQTVCESEIVTCEIPALPFGFRFIRVQVFTRRKFPVAAYVYMVIDGFSDPLEVARGVRSWLTVWKIFQIIDS